MSAKNLCTRAYWNNVRRAGQEKQDPHVTTSTLEPSQSDAPWHSDHAQQRQPAATEKKTPAASARPSEDNRSTVAASSDSLSESSATHSELTGKSKLKCLLRSRSDDICWEDIRLGHRFQPYRQYAHCVEDIHVLARFLELGKLDDVNGDCVKILLRALKLMHLCDYSAEDICSTLAHASYYFLATYEICGKAMDSSEVSHILVLLMFIAHVYVQDETCPLKVWHQHLFRKYCPLKTLNAAVIRLMDIRDHRLRLPSSELSIRYTALMQASRTWNARLQAAGVHSVVDGGTDVLSSSEGLP